MNVDTFSRKRRKRRTVHILTVVAMKLFQFGQVAEGSKHHGIQDVKPPQANLLQLLAAVKDPE